MTDASDAGSPGAVEPDSESAPPVGAGSPAGARPPAGAGRTAVERWVADDAASVALALGAPAAYLAYGLAVQHVRGFPVSPPEMGLGTVVATVAVAELGALARLGYGWGLRAAPALAAVSLLGWPWLTASAPFGNTDVLVPWVVSLYVGSAELARRRPELFEDDHGRTALAVGATLFVGAIAVQTYTRPYLLAVSEGLWWIGALLVAVPAMGVVWLGSVAVLAWRRGLVGPTVVLGGWVAWVLASFLRNVGRYPYTAFNGFGLFNDPAADVRASWALAALGVVAVAGLERWARRRRASSPEVAAQADD